MLTHEDASTLLQRVLGHDRVTRETHSADRLVELCGRMPLALRIAAAKLAARRDAAAGRAGHRADRRGPAGRADRAGRLAQRPRRLRHRLPVAEPLAATLFRRLGSHPGPTFSAHLAAALAGEPGPRRPRRAGRGPPDLRSGRWPLPFPRPDPALRGRMRGPPTSVHRPKLIIFHWYLAMAEMVNRSWSRRGTGSRWPGTAPRRTCRSCPTPTRCCRSWTHERPNLLPIARHAAQHGHSRITWQLTYLLAGYYTHRGYWSDYAEICREGLAAALRLDDPAAERLMRSGSGRGAQRHAPPRGGARAADPRRCELMRDAGDQRGQGMALNNIAHAYAQLGRLDEAVAAFQQALELHTADNHLPGISVGAQQHRRHLHPDGRLGTRPSPTWSGRCAWPATSATTISRARCCRTSARPAWPSGDEDGALAPFRPGAGRSGGAPGRSGARPRRATPSASSTSPAAITRAPWTTSAGRSR